jgi:stage IV sporulation protein FB
MLLREPEPTAMDLRWRMFGIDVRVHPLFWLISAFLGWSYYAAAGGGPRGLAFVSLWVLCVFVSILIHELGHVVAGRWFGASGHIVLHALGGLAIGCNAPSRWQRIVISLAGPGAQFLLLGVVMLGYYPVLRAIEGTDYFVSVYVVFEMLWFINLAWALLNLMPIYPLDGGQVSMELCQGASPRQGRRYALILSIVVAVTLALHIVLAARGTVLIPWIPFEWTPGPLTALFFFLFAVQNYQALQEEDNNRRNWDDDRFPWER